MTEFSRRQALVLAPAAAALPAFAHAQAAADLPTVWDLTHLYPNEAAWDAEAKAVEAALPSLTAYKGKLGASAAGLRTALQAISDLQKRFLRLVVYSTLKADEDLAQAVHQERRQKAQALGAKFGEAVAFVNPEV